MQDNKENKAMTKPEEKKPVHTPLYTIIVGIYRVVSKVLFRMKIVGLENIPQDKNYIIMGNHTHAFDPLTLALCSPKKEIHFMGKKELFKNKFLAWVWTQVHAFPVDRGNMDMAAIRTAMKIIRGGDTLGIFPEGTRSKTGMMGPLLGGASVLALKSGVEVVPVYISGGYKFFRRTTVTIGKPVQVSDLRAQGVDKNACDTFTQRLETWFASQGATFALPAPNEAE